MKPAFLRRRYYNQLEQDMEGWVKSGWVNEEGAQKILSASNPGDTSFRFSMIIGIFGAILLGFAALSFVGANWDEMSKVARIVLLFSVMWAAFAAGWLLDKKGYHTLKESAWLLGGVLFGVNIALIAQIYHIDRHPPDGMMLWGAGMLLIAAALESRFALAASFVIFTLWTGMETNWFAMTSHGAASRVHWFFLVLWGFSALLASRMKWFPAYHLAVLSIGFWLLISLFVLTDGYLMSHLSALATIVLVMVVLTLLALLYLNRHGQGVEDQFSWLLSHYTIGVLALLPLFAQITVGSRLFRYSSHSGAESLTFPLWAGLLIVLPLFGAVLWLLKQHRDRRSFRPVNLLFFGLIASWCSLFILALSLDLRSVIAVLSSPTLFRVFMLAIAIWLVSFGLEIHSPRIVNLGLLSFGIEVLYIYVKLFGTLMDTSLFFLLGGGVLVVLAFGLERMRRKLASNGHKTGGIAS